MSRDHDQLLELLLGAAAGLTATAAMTLLMKPVVGQVLSERWRPAEFVPKQIIEWAEERLAGQQILTERQEWIAAAAAHAGYGATMGALYAVINPPGSGRTPAIDGALWGLIVWMFGYEGWMPAAGVRPATTSFPPTRWPLPILNHVLFGVVTATLLERAAKPSN